MHLKIVYFLKLFLAFTINSSLAHRNLLLFAPGYGGSHVIFHTRIADAIAKAGYNVVSFEPDVHVDPASFEGPKLVERIFLPAKINSTNPSAEADEYNYHELVAKMFEFDGFYSTYMMVQPWQNKMLPICEQMISPEVIERLKAYNFDAIIYEPIFLCATGIGHLLGIKTQIFITSQPFFEYATDLMGLPFPSSHIPSIFMPTDLSDQEFCYFDRFWNIIGVEMSRKLISDKMPVYQKLFRKHYGANFPDLDAIAHEASLCYVEADEFLEFPRPFQSNVIPLGPFGLEEYKNGTKLDLPPKFNAEMEKGQNGVALVSLGTHTMTSMMPKKFLENLLRPMAEHPNLHFVMKVDKEEVENMNILAKSLGVKNVFFAGWIPQPKFIFAHPNLRLFISHSGFNSLQESAFYGIPMVGIPFFVDQLRNAKLAERNGWGIRVKRQQLLLGHSLLANAINEILTNKMYKKNAERTKRLIRNKPMRAEQRLKANLDLLFLHGEGDLPEWKSAARLMGPTTYYNLDIFIPAFLLAEFGLFLFTKLLISIYKKLIPQR